MNLDTAAVNRLRAHILARVPASEQADYELTDDLLEGVLNRIKPFAEIMFLVMAADLDIADEEVQLLVNALAFLCDNTVPHANLQDLVADLRAHAPAAEAVEGRIQKAAAQIGTSREDREVAFLLAAVIAMGDSHVADLERQTVQWVREYLGITRSRMTQLLELA